MEKAERITKYGVAAYKRMRAKARITSNLWNKNHPLQTIVATKKYLTSHKEQTAITKKLYYENHKDELAVLHKAWNRSPAGREADKKSHAKRKGLGFNPINAPFEGAEGHHIMHNSVVYIPKALHRSVYHTLNSGQNIEAINAIALDFLLRGI